MLLEVACECSVRPERGSTLWCTVGVCLNVSFIDREERSAHGVLLIPALFNNALSNSVNYSQTSRLSVIQEVDVSYFKVISLNLLRELSC